MSLIDFSISACNVPYAMIPFKATYTNCTIARQNNNNKNTKRIAH